MLAFASLHAATKDFALHQAVLDNDIQLVKRLLNKGTAIDVIGSRKYGYGSALHLAVRENHLEIAKLLLERDAEVDVLDPDDFTPLHNAAWNGNLEMAKLLLDAGASMHSSTYEGDTPRSLAKDNNRTEMVKFFDAVLVPSVAAHTKSSQDEAGADDADVVDVSGIYTPEITYDDLAYSKRYRFFGKTPNLEITLEQNNDVITGTISGDRAGEFKGVIIGNKITYDFHLVDIPGTDNKEGKGTWLVGDDDDSLRGPWQLSGSSEGFVKGQWNLTKVESEPEQVVDISGTYIVETTGSGSGMNHQLIGVVKKLNGKSIVLQQTGDTITGNGDSLSNPIKGTREGNIINFYTFVHDEITGSWEINADATKLEGKWFTEGAGGASGEWNLTKIPDISGTYVMTNLSGNGNSLRRFLKHPKSKDKHEVSILQNGNQVTATYDDGDGKIWGFIEGHTVRIEWFGARADAGDGKWTIKPSENQIVGEMTFESGTPEEVVKFNLTKIESDTAPIPDISGTYVMNELTSETRFLKRFVLRPESKDIREVTIVQNGNQITATYDEGRGKIWGEIEGHTIKFDWVAHDASSGFGKWTFKPGSNELIGDVSGGYGVGSGSSETNKYHILNLVKIESDAAPIPDISGTYTSEIIYPGNIPTLDYRWFFGKNPDLKVSIEQRVDTVSFVVSGDRTVEFAGVINGNVVTVDEILLLPPQATPKYGSGEWAISEDGASLVGTVRLRGAYSWNLIKWNLTKIESADASSNFLTEEQLLNRIVGNTLKGKSHKYGEFVEYYEPSKVGERKGKIYGKTNNTYSGSWEIDGSIMCFTYPDPSQDDCWMLAVEGNIVTWHKPSGEKDESIPPAILIIGNPNNF